MITSTVPDAFWPQEMVLIRAGATNFLEPSNLEREKEISFSLSNDKHPSQGTQCPEPSGNGVKLQWLPEEG